ncbi:PilZ domain-containing protein [Bradyrhizobium sp. CCBAU 45394]|uniref:PilZ domain-containing protein n=1 Tax=Bradyrhizobium sp. CCBAU 45394 TaxID=1325087 RepID=UPI003FA4CC00
MNCRRVCSRSFRRGGDGAWQWDCTILDISELGARLRVGRSPGVLRTRVFLSFSTTGLVFRRCELVRLEAPEVGVRLRRAGPFAPKRLAGTRLSSLKQQRRLSGEGNSTRPRAP